MKHNGGGLGLGFRAVVWAMIPGLAFLVAFTVGRPLWLDDTHSTFHAFDGLGSVVGHLRSDSHPPLYFMLLAVWMPLAGMGEVALRLPSIAFSLAGGLVLWRSGRLWGGPRLGVLFAAFFLFNPVVVGHFHTVRPYALAGLLATLSTVSYLRLAQEAAGEGSRPRWWTYVIPNVLGTFTHYWFFFLLAGQGVGALLAVPGRRRWALILALAVSVVPFAVLWTPVLLDQMGGAPTSWMSRPGGFWLLSAPIQLVGGRQLRDAPLVFYLVVLAVSVVRIGARPGIVAWPEIRGFLGDRRVWQLAAIPATVLVLAFTLSQIRPVFHVKYTIVAIPAFAMLLGLVVHHLADRRLAWLVPLVFILGSAGLREHLLSYELARDNRAVAEYLVENYEDGDELLHVTLNYAPTLHYLRMLAPDRTFSQTVFPDDVARHPGWRDTDAIQTDSMAFVREARDVAARLASRPGDGRVWLLADFQEDPDFTQLLVEELEPAFEVRQVNHALAWWVTEIRTYVRAGPRGADPTTDPAVPANRPPVGLPVSAAVP